VKGRAVNVNFVTTLFQPPVNELPVPPCQQMQKADEVVSGLRYQSEPPVCGKYLKTIFFPPAREQARLCLPISDGEFFRPLCLIRVMKTGEVFGLESSKCLIENW
jgi:hypothetical protein